MRTPKIYLETTMFNFYLDVDRDAHEDTMKLFQEIAVGKYEPFTSDYVVEELEKAPQDKREKMLSLIGEFGVAVLERNDRAEFLADLYVREGIIPQKYRTDGLHIAIAAINELDMILSTNFKHIVKLKTVRMTAALNTLHGYSAIEIHSPMEVVEYEDD
jgi:predicted nucleic acid-binding protein